MSPKESRISIHGMWPHPLRQRTETGKTAKNLRANEFSFEHAELVAPEHPSKSLLWVRRAEACPFNGSHPRREVPPLLPAPHYLHPEDRTTTPVLHPACWTGESYGQPRGLIGGPRGTWPETDTELEQTVSWKPRELDDLDLSQPFPTPKPHDTSTSSSFLLPALPWWGAGLLLLSVQGPQLRIVSRHCLPPPQLFTSEAAWK